MLICCIRSNFWPRAPRWARSRWRWRADADVHGAEVLDGGGHGARDVPFAAHVTHHRDRPTACGLDVAGRTPCRAASDAARRSWPAVRHWRSTRRHQGDGQADAHWLDTTSVRSVSDCFAAIILLTENCILFFSEHSSRRTGRRGGARNAGRRSRRPRNPPRSCRGRCDSLPSFNRSRVGFGLVGVEVSEQISEPAAARVDVKAVVGESDGFSATARDRDGAARSARSRRRPRGAPAVLPRRSSSGSRGTSYSMYSSSS